MKWLRRIFGLLDTCIGNAILLVGVYWLTWVLNTRYVRIFDSVLEDNSHEIRICLWVLVSILAVVCILIKYQKLRKKDAEISIILFIVFTIIFFIAIQTAILNLCDRVNVIDILLNGLGALK